LLLIYHASAAIPIPNHSDFFNTHACSRHLTNSDSKSDGLSTPFMRVPELQEPGPRDISILGEHLFRLSLVTRISL
ncbi:MAG: hypothetical protein WBE44_16475, partial [Terriglobales bacterium]